MRILLLLLGAVYLGRVGRQFRQEPQLDYTSVSESSSASEPFSACPKTEEALSKIPESCRAASADSKTLPFLIPLYDTQGPGPSAQNLGFRQVLHSAKTLNRTLILTDFIKHKTDNLSDITGNKPRVVPLGVRIDLETLCRYVTIVSDAELGREFYKRRANDAKVVLMFNRDLLEVPGNGQRFLEIQKETRSVILATLRI